MTGAKSLLTRYRQSNSNLSPEDNIRVDPYVEQAVTERLISDLRKAL